MKALLILLLATPLHAGELSDAIFAPGMFQSLEGDLRYAHTLRLPGRPEARDTLTLAPEADRLALLRDEAKLTDFGRGSAHPVLMFFLESTVRHMAEATGGSPFYIRNRIRDAVGAAPLGQDLRPFAADPNRDAMGDFAGLTLRFAVEEGRIISLSADTPGVADGYHESMILEDR